MRFNKAKPYFLCILNSVPHPTWLSIEHRNHPGCMINHPFVSPLIGPAVVRFGDAPHQIGLLEQVTVLLLLRCCPPGFKLGERNVAIDRWRGSRCGVAQRFLQPINLTLALDFFHQNIINFLLQLRHPLL
jgi:hypothetical protein